MTRSDSSSDHRRLWLVRHGETTWNARGLAQGHTSEPSLTERGLRQADRSARILASEPIVAVITSDLHRAVQTAAPIARALDLDVIEEPRLRERSLGTAEGTPAALIPGEQTGIVRNVVVDADAAPPDGESVRQLYGRAVGIVTELAGDGPDGDVAVVCHGGVIRVVLAWLDGVGPDDMPWPAIANGGVTLCAVPRTRMGAVVARAP